MVLLRRISNLLINHLLSRKANLNHNRISIKLCVSLTFDRIVMLVQTIVGRVRHASLVIDCFVQTRSIVASPNYYCPFCCLTKLLLSTLKINMSSFLEAVRPLPSLHSSQAIDSFHYFSLLSPVCFASQPAHVQICSSVLPHPATSIATQATTE